MGNRKYTEKLIFIALLVALSVVFGYIDNFLSGFASQQGVRLGLANIVILTGLYYLKFWESLLLVILKSLLTGLLLGNLTTFVIGFSGTITSFFIMYLLLRFFKKSVSLVGVSISGSIFHNIGQILTLSLLYTTTIIFMLIWLIPMGILTGVFIGYIVSLLRKYLDKGQVFRSITMTSNSKPLHLIIGEENE